MLISASTGMEVHVVLEIGNYNMDIILVLLKFDNFFSSSNVIVVVVVVVVVVDVVVVIVTVFIIFGMVDVDFVVLQVNVVAYLK